MKIRREPVPSGGGGEIGKPPLSWPVKVLVSWRVSPRWAKRPATPWISNQAESRSTIFGLSGARTRTNWEKPGAPASRAMAGRCTSSSGPPPAASPARSALAREKPSTSSRGRGPPPSASSTAIPAAFPATGARPRAARAMEKGTSAGTTTVGRSSRSAAISRPASSAGSVALISRASSSLVAQKVSAQSATHSRWSATPPGGRSTGRPKTIGSPPASRMEPTYPSASEGIGTKTRGGRPRGVSPPGTRLLAVKLLREELADPPAVGAAAGRPHNLAHEKANDLRVSGPGPPGLVRVRGDHLVHHPRELVAAERGQTLPFDHRGGRIARLEDCREDVPRGGAGDRAALDETDHLRQVSRGHLRLRDPDPRLVQTRLQLAGRPVGGLLWVRLRGDPL